MDIRDFKNKLLREDIKDFQIGKTTETPSGKTTITDIDPETQSVTWTVNKDLTDSDIHRDLSKLINKLESNQKRYHDQKRIKQLLQKLKFIRNTFKRTSIEEIKIDKPKQRDILGVFVEKLKNINHIDDAYKEVDFKGKADSIYAVSYYDGNEDELEENIKSYIPELDNYIFIIRKHNSIHGGYYFEILIKNPQ